MEGDKNVDVSIGINVNETTFKLGIISQNGKTMLKAQDYSLDWLKARLEKYPNNAHTIYSVVTNEINTIQDKAEKKLKNCNGKNKIMIFP